MKVYTELSLSQPANSQASVQRIMRNHASSIIDNRPTNVRQRYLQAVAAKQPIQQIKRVLSPRMDKIAAPIQLKLCGGAVPDTSVAALYTWQYNSTTTVRLEAGKNAEGADRSWKLTLAENGTDKGTISLLYFESDKKFKPDNLEVPNSSDRMKGYGLVLSKFAIRAVNEVAEVKEVRMQSSSLELNLMSPISAYISVKELFSFFGSFETDETLKEQEEYNIGERVLDAFNAEGGVSKGFKVEKFPLFWAKLVYLAKENDVQFHNNALVGGEYTEENALALLKLMAKANVRSAHGFGLNVNASLGNVPALVS